MAFVAIATIGAAAVGAGTSIYNAVSQPDLPSVSPPPPPSSYYSYDANGNLTGSQVWNKDKNAYEYNAAQLTPAQQADQTARNNLRSQMLGNLSQTPADRIQAYRNYADAYSASMHAQTDPQYQNTVRANEENMASRGMMGSRAYVDSQDLLSKQKNLQDTQIGNEATMGANTLAQNDKNTWLGTLNQLDTGARADTMLAQNQSGIAANNVNMANSNASNNWQAQYGMNMGNYNAQVNQNNAIMGNLTNTATGLAFLYGYGGMGKSPITPTTPNGGGVPSGGGSPYSLNTGPLLPSYN